MSKYYLFQLTQEGPSRVQGAQYYTNLREAKQSAAELAKNSNNRIGIFELIGSVWRNPTPEIFGRFS